MKPHLVTGATGFIGSHLARRLLAEGRSVRVLCRPGSENKLPRELRERADVTQGDLRFHDSLAEAVKGTSTVYHCAGLVSDWGRDSDFAEVNVAGTLRLLEASRAEGVSRFVHLSSIAVFGTPAPAYFDDASPYGASEDGYSRTKSQGEKAVFDFHRQTGFPVSVLRPAVVYGPGGTWLEEPLSMVRKGKMFLLGGGRGTCHPCYIENLLDAIGLAAVHPEAVGQGFIVADDDPISFKEYFNAVASIADHGPISKSIPLPVAFAMASIFEKMARISGGQNRRSRPLLTKTAIHMVTAPSRMDMTKIKRTLGFVPRYDFKAAIARIKSERVRRPE